MLDGNLAGPGGAGEGGSTQLLAGVLAAFSKRPAGDHEELQPGAEGPPRRQLSYPDPFYPQV